MTRLLLRIAVTRGLLKSIQFKEVLAFCGTLYCCVCGTDDRFGSVWNIILIAPFPAFFFYIFDVG